MAGGQQGAGNQNQQPPAGAKKYPKSTRHRDALRVIARQYPAANANKPSSFFDDSLTVAWGSQEHFTVTRQLGKGKYGEVYESQDLRTASLCVVKIMRPVKEHRLRRELKILSLVRGGPNIVSFKEVVRDPDTKTPCFVFELVDAMSFRELQASVSDLDVRHYMFQLLQALDYTHSMGIMHRDVKPGNVLIDHKKRQLKLIDWGLADFYHQGKEYPVRVATRFYKGPELLIDIRDYDYSLDVWGMGCMLAALVFKRPVFFRGEDEFDQLVKIARVLGSEGLHKYCDKYGVELDPRLDQMVGVRPVTPWRKFCNAENGQLCTPEAFDLLDRLLRYDHHERLTCAEAMAHPYFDQVRTTQATTAATDVGGALNGSAGASHGGNAAQHQDSWTLAQRGGLKEGAGESPARSSHAGVKQEGVEAARIGVGATSKVRARSGTGGESTPTLRGGRQTRARGGVAGDAAGGGDAVQGQGGRGRSGEGAGPSGWRVPVEETVEGVVGSHRGLAPQGAGEGD